VAQQSNIPGLAWRMQGYAPPKARLFDPSIGEGNTTAAYIFPRTFFSFHYIIQIFDISKLKIILF
jgi:hypothetical protein